MIDIDIQKIASEVAQDALELTKEKLSKMFSHLPPNASEEERIIAASMASTEIAGVIASRMLNKYHQELSTQLEIALLQKSKN